MQFFWKFLFPRRIENRQHWRCDPLAHPDLERMTLTELADLPLGSAWISKG